MCDVGKYLDYESCKWRKRLIDKLAKECSENVDENEMTNVTLNEYRNIYGSCTIYITLFAIAFLIIIGIRNVFIYFCWYLKGDTNITKINSSTETVVS